MSRDAIILGLWVFLAAHGPYGRTLLAILAILSAGDVLANEDAHNRAWCASMGGQPEARIDGGRIDCLLDEYAVEADWSSGLKPDECIGQAARYAIATGRRPGCLLIVTEPQHCRYLERARSVVPQVWVRVGDAMYPVRLWVIGTEVCGG